MSQPFWLALGCLAVVCGVAGIVLPMVPTTPFILLAAYAFARSSPRLLAWLETHRIFGPAIVNWRTHGSIDRNAKRLAIGLMLAGFIVGLVLHLPLWVLIAQGTVLVAVAIFILSRPDTPR